MVSFVDGDNMFNNFAIFSKDEKPGPRRMEVDLFEGEHELCGTRIYSSALKRMKEHFENVASDFCLA